MATKDNEIIDISQKKMLSTKEAMSYYGLSRVYLRAWATKLGAVKKIGRRVFYDKNIIDKFVEQLEPEPVKK